MSIDNLNVEQKENKKEQVNLNVFLDSRKIYEKFSTGKVAENIFSSLYNEFLIKLSDKNKQLLNNFFEKDFFDKKNGVKQILATILFLGKQGEKAEKKIKIFLNKKPALIKKLVNGFSDEVDRLIKAEQIKEKAEQIKEKAEQTKEKAEQIKERLDQKLKLNQETLHQLAQKLKQQILEKAPEYKDKIQEQASKLQKQYPKLNQDQAYLLTFNYFYQKDLNLRKEIKLDTQELALISSVREQFSNIKINSILSEKEVQEKFMSFVESKDYDDKLSDKLEKAKFDIQTQKLLSEKYPNFVQTALNKIAQDNKLKFEELKDNYLKYLSGEHTKYDKIYKKLGQQLVKKFNEQLSIFPKEYKKIAIQEYTKSIFSMLDKAVGMYSLQTNFDKTDNFDIKNSNISFSLKYEGVPLNIKVTKDGDILMTNYLARENQGPNSLGIKEEGTFQVKETKVNQFFSFVGLEEILSPEDISYEDLLKDGKDLEKSMENKIRQLVSKKIEKDNSLGNTTVMKAELSDHMENQKIAYDLIKLYRPPLENNYLTGEGRIGENNEGLFILMNRLSRTANLDEKTYDILNKFYSNDKIKDLLSELDKVKINDKPLSTYEFFKRAGFLGTEGKLNLYKIEKFANKIEKVNTRLDLRKLPKIEGLEWDILPSGKIKLKSKDEDEISLLENISNFSEIKFE